MFAFNIFIYKFVHLHKNNKFVMCLKRKITMIKEIRFIPVSINEHNPKAQSVCYPDTPVDYNEFYKNLYKQIKNYDTQRSHSTKTESSVREKNRNDRSKW